MRNRREDQLRIIRLDQMNKKSRIIDAVDVIVDKDIYVDTDDFLDDDEITGAEQGFMIGYMAA